MKLLTKILFLFYILPLSAQNENWQSLFDGKSLKGWTQFTGTGLFTVENDMIVGSTVKDSPNSFLVYDQHYSEDFVLEMETMMSDANTNTGVQFRSNFDPKGNKGQGLIYGYQLDIDPTERNWSGGIYDEGRREWLYPVSHNPKAQRLFTTNAFHKIRIECIGNTIKTWLDGNPVSYVRDTIRSNEGLIALQVHNVPKPENAGTKIYWKNIRIQTKHIKPQPFPKGIYMMNLQANQLEDYEKKSGWKLLFDGTTTKEWLAKDQNKYTNKGWKIKDGVLKTLPNSGQESNLWNDIISKKAYSAFDLSFDFKLTKGADSGFNYFVDQNRGSGLEYQLIDDQENPDAKNANHSLASLYDLIKAEKTARFVRLPNKWNHARIIVHPNRHIEHYLNGIKVLEYELGSKEFDNLLSKSIFKDESSISKTKKGHLLIQNKGNEVSFRSIKIRELKP